MAFTSAKRDIGERYNERAHAEHYRDRFKHGKRLRTHLREARSLERHLATLGELDVVVDVASGCGRFAPVFSAVARRLIQLDFSRNMLDITLEDYPLPASRALRAQADARCIPLQSDSVDVVFCHRLLNHIPAIEDRAKIWSELARVSRKYIIASCLEVPPFVHGIRKLYWRFSGRSAEKTSFELAGLLEDARKAGLTLIARTPIRRWLWSSAYFTFTKQS